MDASGVALTFLVVLCLLDEGLQGGDRALGRDPSDGAVLVRIVHRGDALGLNCRQSDVDPSVTCREYVC